MTARVIKTAYQGTDPGQSGAWCQIGEDGRTVVAWAVWQKMLRKTSPDVYRLRWDDRTGAMMTMEFERYSDMCEQLFHLAHRARLGYDRVLLVVEEIFVPTWDSKRKRKNKDGSDRKVSMQDAIKLAESAGKLMGHLEVAAQRDASRVRALTWRPAVAGIHAKTEAEEAERLAIKYAPNAFKWEAPWPEAGTKVERGALAESVFMARWGWTKRTYLLASKPSVL